MGGAVAGLAAAGTQVATGRLGCAACYQAETDGPSEEEPQRATCESNEGGACARDPAQVEGDGRGAAAGSEAKDASKVTEVDSVGEEKRVEQALAVGAEVEVGAGWEQTEALALARPSDTFTAASGANVLTLPTLALELEDKTLLRGVALPGLLWRFGRHFKAKALADQAFTEAEAAWLFAHSREVGRLHEFLSHSWRDSAWMKFLALCLYYNSLPASIFSCLVGLVCLVLQIAGVVPTWGVSWVTTNAGLETHVFSGLCLFVNTVVQPIAMLTWHHAPAWLGGGRGRAVFLDKLCVHQHDAARKMAGIRSFGAFVAKSDRLLILWSPGYFTRLWCTLEVAAFVHIQRSARDSFEHTLPGHLAFLPLQLTSLTCACLVVGQLFLIVSTCAIAAFNNSLAGIAFLTVTIPSGVHAMRAYARDRDVLTAQLEEFSVESAQCFSEADRNLVYSSIEQWFRTLERFSAHVKTEVARYVRATIPSSTAYPFVLSRCTYVPCVMNVFDGVPGLLGFEDRSYALAALIHTCSLPIMAELLLSLGLLCTSFACVKRKRRRAVCDVLLTIVTTQTIVFVVGAVWITGRFFRRLGPLLIVAWVLLKLALVLALRGELRRLAAPCARRQQG